MLQQQDVHGALNTNHVEIQEMDAVTRAYAHPYQVIPKLTAIFK